MPTNGSGRRLSVSTWSYFTGGSPGSTLAWKSSRTPSTARMTSPDGTFFASLFCGSPQTATGNEPLFRSSSVRRGRFGSFSRFGRWSWPPESIRRRRSAGSILGSPIGPMPSASLGLARADAAPSARASTIGTVVVTASSNSLITTKGFSGEPSGVATSFAPPEPGFGISEPRPVIADSAFAAPPGASSRYLRTNVG